ncbi:MAG TPA: FHA domain-containing protein [Chloroflexia bacterium]|nr:FHA domain-containing protein [Chloroflexia bacterium]
MAIYCSNCGVELPDGVSFCDACGTPVRGQGAAAPVGGTVGVGASAPAGNGLGTTSCPVCGASAMPGEAFCDNCGASLMAPASGVSSPSYSPPPSYSSAPMASGGGTYSSAAPAAAPSRQIHASLVITSPPPPATIQIPNRNELIVGRSDPQSNSYPDVDLGPYGGLDLGVSRRHFRLTRTGDNFYLEDLNAMNGSIVNGQRVPPYTLHPLRNGDRIVLGKLEMVFEVA